MQRGRHILQALSLSWLSLVVTVVTQLVQIPIALAHLTKPEFSLFAIFSQLLGYLFILDFGASSAFARLLIDGRTQGDQTYGSVWMSGFALLAIQAGLMLAVVTAATPLIPSLFNVPDDLAASSNRVFWCLGAVLALRQATVIIALTIWAAQRIALANVIQLCATLLQFAVFVATVGPLKLWSYVLSMLVGSLLPHACYFVVCVRAGLLPKWSAARASRRQVAGIFSLGLDALAISIFGIVVNSSFLVFAGMVLPLERVAALSVNLKPVQLFAEAIRRIPQNCEPYFANLISSGDLVRFRFGWMLEGKAVLFLGLLGAAVYAVLCPWIIRWWTSADFVLGPSEIALLSLIPLRQALHVQFANHLFLFKALYRIRLVLLVEAILFAGSAFFLGNRFGATGLLAAYFLTFAVGALLPASRELVRLAEISASDFRGLFGGATKLLAAVCFAVLAGLPWLHDRSLAVTVAGVAAAAAAASWLFVTRSLSPEEKAYAAVILRGSGVRQAGS
ncbi:MAG: hypothetical protein V1929_10940 [bacterium]